MYKLIRLLEDDNHDIRSNSHPIAQIVPWRCKPLNHRVRMFMEDVDGPLNKYLAKRKNKV